jgi:hypothetical protein
VHEFSYAVELLPPGRLPFHRWRWELWQGAWLLGAGWGTAPADAERALLRAATRRVHEMLGVRALRLDGGRMVDDLRPGRSVRVDTGAGLCLLVPRTAPDVAAAA